MFCDCRYFKHLIKLIEATHILCSTQISTEQLDRAENLLQSFVQDFEEHYGQANMVFNIHLLLHTAQCVRKNGPLFGYSNYAFEDYIGNLKGFVLAPTDVLHQITTRYLMKKSVETHLEKSDLAKAFNYRIRSLHFANTVQLGRSLLIGKAKVLDENDSVFIRNELGMDITEVISSYRALFVHENIYFETTEESEKKQTNDAFVCSPNSGIFGEIKNIVVARQNSYFLINNKYEADGLKGIQPFIYELVAKPTELCLIPADLIDSKYAFIKINAIITCAKFPNVYERN